MAVGVGGGGRRRAGSPAVRVGGRVGPGDRLVLAGAGWLPLSGAMDPVIRFRSAVALAGRFPVLAGVDLDIWPSEIVLLQGANGAGKTSILRACAGLLRVVAGEADVLGVDLTADPRPVRRRVGLLGHASALYDDLGVADNVSFAVRAAGGDRRRVGPALDRLGLVGRLPGTAVGALSAGQRRRVALAVLVARDTQLWFLDEPHPGLDPDHR
ncbi:MAG: ABC transporter ATP-binding protein, partial [Acidimicrobiales bacterium]